MDTLPMPKETLIMPMDTLSIPIDTASIAMDPLSFSTDNLIVPVDTPTTPIDNSNEPSTSEIQPSKRRRQKSVVWEHFTVVTLSPGCTRACCNQCKRSFAYISGSKLAGTSHLKRHIALGICPVSRQKNQLSPVTPNSKTDVKPPKRRYRKADFVSIPVDQEHCNHELAKMIIQHDYPLDIVQQRGFIDFVRTLQPHYNMASLNTIQGECVAIYLREKQNILNLLSGIPGRVCLTLDLLTSDQTFGYVTLTGNFIDEDWNLHRPILSVVMVQDPDSDDALSQAVITCLSDWALGNRLFTLTIDQSILNETRVGNLSNLFSIKKSLMLNGQFLLQNCYARLLSRLAQDALGTLGEAVRKIRESVKYVKTSEAREEKFMELKQQLQVPGMKILFIDDQTKWDTTYNMLVAACELKEVFTCLDTSDPNYKETPSMDEWKQVETMLLYLKLLFVSACNLARQTYPTASFFFYDAWQIQLELYHSANCEDPFVRNLTKPLHEKFNKYWNDTFLVLAIAVVMDPRFKMKLVDFSFRKFLGDDTQTWINIVDNDIHELYLDYVVSSEHTNMEEINGDESIIKTEMHLEEQDDAFLSITGELSDFDVYISEITDIHHESKSELDQYLDESLLPPDSDFDVLGWWKLNKLRYPTLSIMASDILSIPVCTVGSDSVFDTGNKRISSYQSSLPPVTLEALVCAKEWLRYGPSLPDASNATVKMEN